jgi:hypothetical protein
MAVHHRHQCSIYVGHAEYLHYYFATPLHRLQPQAEGMEPCCLPHLLYKFAWVDSLLSTSFIMPHFTEHQEAGQLLGHA